VSGRAHFGHRLLGRPLPTSKPGDSARSEHGEDLLFPVFEYLLDESDPDIVVLHRQDDTFVAAFSARGVTREGIIEAAKEDYRELLRHHWAGQKEDTDQHESA
jgi:hypothetical protein